MEMTVECKTRDAKAKPKSLRRQGLIPAVLYGHKGADSVSLTLDAKAADFLVRNASINNTLVRVQVADLSWSGRALIRDVHTHPAKGYLYHLSFFSVAAQDTIEVTVPIHFIGEAVGVVEERGALDTVLTELQVQCDPDHIPESIEIDVSALKIGDALQVRELVLPNKVNVVGEPERVVASVLPPRLAPEPEEAEPVDPAVAEALAIMDADGDVEES
ncbi:MAG TPA: 50S ribosomal protein L25/general stress protein Ctc [Elainellaceae cyanobacterium]